MPLRKFSLSSRTVHWCPCRQGKFSLLLGTVKIYLEGTEITVGVHAAKGQPATACSLTAGMFVDWVGLTLVVNRRYK